MSSLFQIGGIDINDLTLSCSMHRNKIIVVENETQIVREQNLNCPSL